MNNICCLICIYSIPFCVSLDILFGLNEKRDSLNYIFNFFLFYFGLVGLNWIGMVREKERE